MDHYSLHLSFLSTIEAYDRPLQCFGGIVTVSVGHCHSRIVEAINRQNQLLQHTTTIYLNNEVAQYAKELVDKLPGKLKVGAPNAVDLQRTGVGFMN